MMSRQRWLSLLMLFPLAGCYTYTPPVANVAPGVRVRARITVDAAERLSPVLGRTDRVLEGRVRESTPELLLLDVPAATVAAGGSTRWFTQGVSVPRSQLIELEIRRLDRWRTAGVVALGAVVAGVLVAQTFERSPGAPPLGDGKGGSDAWRGGAGW